MEQGPAKRVEPGEFRRQARLVAFMGLAGDVAIAAVFLIFEPFEPTITYALAAALLASGVFFTYLFGVRFPRNYEKNYARMYEPKLK